MNQSEIDSYKTYLSSMTDEQLDVETETVICQNFSAMAIQFCYNEWKRRGKDKNFLTAYNKTLDPIEKDFH